VIKLSPLQFVTTGKRLRDLWKVTLTVFLWMVVGLSCQALVIAPAEVTNKFRPDRLLIKPRKEVASAMLNGLHQTAGGSVHRRYPTMGDLQVIRLPANVPVSTALRLYRASGLVEYAEPDYILHAAREPNDFHYSNGSQWPLFNWGQLGGTTDCDIDAPEAWDLASDAGSVLVSVIDSGIRVTHEDLVPNLWVNPGEIPGNGIDDDANGYIDDVHGINAINGTGNIVDEPSHGTHVAGILGAVGNNGIGIAGVAWRVKMMGCKFLDAQFQGAVSDAIECINYSRLKGARIINASWGGQTATQYSSAALYDAINSLRQAGIIFVAAAGNFTLDNDSSNAFYPASFDLDNIISVAATTRDDDIAHFSDYGLNSVDLGAPGYIVLSCWSSSDTAYDYDNGTSMAAPHVAAACALAWNRFPGESYSQIIQRVLAAVDPVPALAGKCRTGGRLNLKRVLEISTASVPLTLTPQAYDEGQFQLRITGNPNTTVALQVSTDLQNWSSIQTNQIASDGSLEITDPNASTPLKFYRAVVP
jgi:subtilisin family serine protease